VYRLVSTDIDVAPEPMRSEALSSVVADLVAVVGTTDDDDEEEDADADVDDGGGKANRRMLGSGGLAARAVRRCASPDSHGRLAELLVEAISAEVAAMMTEEEGRGGGGDDDDDDLRALCRALCRTLCLSGDASLAEKCGTSLLSKLFADAAAEDADDAKNDAPPLLLLRRLRDTFAETAEKGGIGVVYPALSLASSLLPPLPPAGGSGDDGASEAKATLVRLSGIFVERTFSPPSSSSAAAATTNGQAPPSSSSSPDVRTARTFLRLAASAGTFDGRVSPIVVLRLRSHPERTLPAVESILSSYCSSSPPPPPSRAETTLRSRFAAAAEASSSRRIPTWCRP